MCVSNWYEHCYYLYIMDCHYDNPKRIISFIYFQ
jgi:hypothetical protein